MKMQMSKVLIMTLETEEEQAGAEILIQDQVSRPEGRVGSLEEPARADSV